MDPTETTAFDATTDICTQLMHRYSSSSAPHHRHLTATAAAIKTLLQEDSLPLSPLSYFAAVMTALSQPLTDPASASALATLLSIVLPLVPEGEISAEKAADATEVLVRVCESEEREVLVGSASSARCVVKSLGVLLGFCELGDWKGVQLGFRALLNWCMDKRPKVRKCALVYLENGLKSFQSRSVKKKASKLIMSLLETHMSAASKLGVLQIGVGNESGRQCEAEWSDIVHALCVVRVAFPYLSSESSKLVISKLLELLTLHNSAITRPVLNAIQAFMEKYEVEIINEVAEDIIGALSSYVSSKTNPKDSVISAANLLKVSLDKLHPRDTGKLLKSLSIGVKAIAGLLMLEDDIASESSIILKNLIVDHFPDLDFQAEYNFDERLEEQKSIASMCSTFIELLDSFAGIPNEHTLAVLSVMFLKLGRSSSSLTRTIVLKLAEVFDYAGGKTFDTSNLEFCFGCAVVAMGAENILGLAPISFNVENLTYTNIWMVPILKNYTCGSSLECFVEHIAPVAQSLQKASRKVKKSVIGQDLQAHAIGLWGLLPAFCRYPRDISKSFQSFAKLILSCLKKNAFMHEDIAEALQELIIQNKCLPKSDASIVEPIKHKLDMSLQDYLMEKRNLFCYSKKAATKNIKALSSFSDEFLQALITIFLDSMPVKRSSLKKAIGCLASITNSHVAKKIFLSSLERFPVVKAASAAGDSDASNSLLCDVPLESSSVDNSQWSLILDLASSIVEGADEDLIGLVFRLTKIALQAGDGLGVAEAYNTLSCVLEAHPHFCSLKMNELVDFMIGLKTPVDIASFNNRLSSLHLLLIHALKSSSDVENTKPFLILNEIIMALKDSREEARKIAYDILLKISSCLEDPSATNCDGPYYRLISMILGYLSGPSPHITSAAVSALSVLVFKDPELCVRVPDVASTVSSLLQTKAVETIKAVLGFIKVLVSCLEAKDLHNFVQVIVDGVLPWSSVSRHHFRTKVTVILEILIRKLGLPAIKLVTPERFHSFIRKVSQNHHGKPTSKEPDSSDKTQPSDNTIYGTKKRSRKETNHDGSGSGSGLNLQRNKKRKQIHKTNDDGSGSGSGLNLQRNNKRKQVSDSQFRGSSRSNVAFDKKNSNIKPRKSDFRKNKNGQNVDRSSKSTQMRHGWKNDHKDRSRR